MGCDPCKKVFVEVARLLQALRSEPLSPDVAAQARRCAGLVVMAGEMIVEKEIKRSS